MVMIPEFRREIEELNDVYAPPIRRPDIALDRRYFRLEGDTFGSDVMSRRRNRKPITLIRIINMRFVRVGSINNS